MDPERFGKKEPGPAAAVTAERSEAAEGCGGTPTLLAEDPDDGDDARD